MQQLAQRSSSGADAGGVLRPFSATLDLRRPRGYPANHSPTASSHVAPPPAPPAPTAAPCPRCQSTDTKFCYYNNYNTAQPRHFCKACRRFWTRGGTLRNVPVGGGSRKSKRGGPTSSKSKKKPRGGSTSAVPAPAAPVEAAEVEEGAPCSASEDYHHHHHPHDEILASAGAGDEDQDQEGAGIDVSGFDWPVFEMTSALAMDPAAAEWNQNCQWIDVEADAGALLKLP